MNTTTTTQTSQVIAPAPAVTQLDTWSDLVRALGNHVVAGLRQFNATGNLLQSNHSSWIWLTPDLELRAIQCSTTKNRRPVGGKSGELFVEVFKSSSDSNPSSHFHKWVDDSTGAFVGVSKSSPLANPVWDVAAKAADKPILKQVWSGMGFQPFRLEKCTQVEIDAILGSSAYTRHITANLAKWLLEKKCACLKTHLSHRGLSDAARVHGQKFVKAVGGREEFRNLAITATRSYLAQQIAMQTKQAIP